MVKGVMDAQVVSEDAYKKLFQVSPDLLCIANADGYFIEVNPAFTKTLGYDNHELVRRPFFDLVHPQDHAKTHEAIIKLAEGEAIREFENRYLHKEGHYVTLSWTAYPDLETGLFYSTGRDISSRKAIQNRLDQIQNVLNDETIIAITDKAGVITEVNDKFCEISGYSSDELIGQTHAIVNSGEHPKEFFQKLWQTISAGKIWSGLIVNRKKNGEKYYVQSIISPFTDIQGQVTSYLSIRYDVTSQAEIEEKLNKTLTILNETSAIAKVGGWELNISTQDLTWTDQTFEIFELDKNPDNKPILPEGLEFYTPDHKVILEKALNLAITDGIPYALELKAKTTKGRELWVYTTGKPNIIDGEVVSLSGTIQDITEQKVAEMKYNLERQRSIHNSKLAALGELSASIAHEINNPLAIIQGSAFLLGRGTISAEELANKADDIYKCCERIARIVKSLKKFSRYDEEKQRQIKTFEEIINESLLLTESRAKKSHTPIEFSCESKAAIFCDEIEIEQVIVNLINNAIDAIKPLDNKWILISLKEVDTKLVLTVSDSGTGIDKNVAKKLFDPFFTTKKGEHGTGLGLSIVRGILEEHNATIEIDRAAMNTTFVIEFPIYNQTMEKSC